MTDITEPEFSRRISRRDGINTYKTNPFLESHLTPGTKRIRAGGDYLTTITTGEAVQTTVVNTVVRVDPERYMKLYADNIKALFHIKPSTQKVLQALLVALQRSPNKDSVYLSWHVCEDFSELAQLKISRTSFHSAMRELLEKCFIAESEEPNRFWINPNLIFNGSRMAFVNEYERVDASEASPD